MIFRQVSFSQWPYSYFPYYCNGATYLLTTTAVTAIFLQTPFTSFIPIEDDLFTGILRHQASVTIHDRWQYFGSPAYLKTASFQSPPCNLYDIPLLAGIYLESNITIESVTVFYRFQCSNTSWFFRQKSAQNALNLEMFFG